jgi:hypothetical protein
MKTIVKRFSRDCVICGKKMNVKVYKDHSYRGGHYFGKLKKNAEYWECPKCYWP